MLKKGYLARIRADLFDFRSDKKLDLCDSMMEYAGRQCIVTSVSLPEYGAPRYHIDIDNGMWDWDQALLIPVKETTAIKDSGDRTEYSTGAVRDCKEGKGRCDLMPPDVVADLLESGELAYIAEFKSTGDPKDLYEALRCAADGWFSKNDECDIPSAAEMLLEVAKHFEAGAKKYGENNWQKGIPLHSYIDSAIRHYLKHEAGWTDERHDRAFCWNLICAIWTREHFPTMDDYTDSGKRGGVKG